MSGTYIEYPDEELLHFISHRNDEMAFEELYRRYFPVLFNYVYEKINDRFGAQEIVQELFVSLWQQRDRSSIQACRPYLFSIAKKLVITFYRKEFTRQRHYQQWDMLHTDTTDLSDQAALTTDLQDRYEKGLDLLPAKCREVFILSRQGTPNREIARQLEISEKTVEQHITKALRILRQYLKDYLPYVIIFLQLFP